ncbi:hypothetical protein GH714_017795 [Hevea brasiliensis]|uniref:Alkyl transferase n=1 Tax=Hevea brasiliensis TaxID=3981 RepID=A0A6A6MEQ5_HEVBR|nr:hypothetical protein GH714_017795 [Hevea brasiliensis]
MEIFEAGRPSVLASLGRFIRKCIFRILSIGPIPSHVAFIMDGNRRFAKKEKLEEGSGHRAGSLALMSTLKRRPDEVQLIMDLILEKIEGLLRDENVVNAYGIRVRFVESCKDETDKSRTINAKPMYNGVTKEAGGTDNANTVIVNSIGDKWDDAHELEATRTGNGVISVEEIDKMLSHSSIKLVDIEKNCTWL